MAYLATYGGPRSERRFSETADVSLWSPLRQTTFLGLFVAAFGSNIGTWIQNVSAAWLMTLLAPNPLMVGLVQTLSGLPVFLLIIPAGALTDGCPFGSASVRGKRGSRTGSLAGTGVSRPGA